MNVLRLAFFEIQKKSLNTYLGWIWSLVNPLAQMGLLYFIMTYVFKTDRPHILLWLISGLSTWIVIQGSIMRTCSSIVSRSALIQNNNISIGLLVAADILSEVLILLPFYFIGCWVAISDGSASWNLLMIPVLLLCLILFLFGCGMILATLTPLFRDLPHIIGLGLQVAFWLTPITFNKLTMPGNVRMLVQLNPFTYFVELSHAAFFEDPVTLELVAIPFLLSVVFILLGTFISQKLQGSMAIHL